MPLARAVRATARTAAFIPWASPPLVRTATARGPTSGLRAGEPAQAPPLAGRAGGDAGGARPGDRRHRPGLPDVRAVLPDGAVGREVAAADGVQDGHPRPPLRVPERLAGGRLAVDVGPVVGQEQVAVVAQQPRDERGEAPGL